MTDSVEVFAPGYRLTDSSTGAPLSGGVIEFYDAGTTTPKTVYRDKDLTISLGTSVTTDGLGYPTSDGSTKTLIYVGTNSYKVVIKNSTGSTIAEHDYVKGAVATIDPGSLSVVSSTPVESKTDYTVLSTDQNKVLAVNCTSANRTITLPSATSASIGNGWGVTVQHAGTANTVTVSTVSSQSIYHGATNLGTSTKLNFNGEEITLVSNGTDWRLSPRIQQFVPSGTIMIHGATTAPTGWLSCDGSAISRTVYAALFAAIGTTFGVGNGSTTFNIPDMRGQFARGWDNRLTGAGGQDADATSTARVFGSTQTDAFKSHSHPTNGAESGYKFAVDNTSVGDDQFDYGVSGSVNSQDAGYSTNSRTDVTGGTETRPKNIALLYIIKV